MSFGEYVVTFPDPMDTPGVLQRFDDHFRDYVYVTLRMMLNKGGSLMTRGVDEYGNTPLHHAALMVSTRVGYALVDLLLAHGANKFTKNNDGYLPCHLAVIGAVDEYGRARLARLAVSSRFFAGLCQTLDLPHDITAIMCMKKHVEDAEVIHPLDAVSKVYLRGSRCVGDAMYVCAMRNPYLGRTFYRMVPTEAHLERLKVALKEGLIRACEVMVPVFRRMLADVSSS